MTVCRMGWKQTATPDEAVTGAYCLHASSLHTTTPGMVLNVEPLEVKTRNTVSHCPHAVVLACWCLCSVSTIHPGVLISSFITLGSKDLFVEPTRIMAFCLLELRLADE